MQQSKKIPIIFIAVLTIGIIYIQYRIVSIENKNIKEDGNVKSAQNNVNNDPIAELKPNNLNFIPKKSEGYRNANIWAKNYILLDASSYYPLAEKNSHYPVPIASTTKIMTATIVLENYKLNDIITISPNAAAQIGSDVMLRSGEKLTVESLLYALLVQSGNDAAMALAENYPNGGLEGFINAMNAKAKYLGMDTQFKDPAGLDDTGLSSAFDLAIVTSYIINNPIFSKIVKTSEITISSIDGKFLHKLDNSNRLIKVDEPLYYPYALGVKTGFTPEAGHCLVSAAEKNGKKIISVVLNTIENTNDASAKESKKLLEWGFANYNY